MKTRVEFVVDVETVDNRWHLMIVTNGQHASYRYSKHVINFLFGGLVGMVQHCSILAFENRL